jgi:hypothetical protein
MMYNDMESHLQKLRLHFQMCKEYGICLKPDKCAFMVFSGDDLGFYYWETTRSKKKYMQL